MTELDGSDRSDRSLVLAGAGNMHLSDKFDIACFSKGLVEAGLVRLEKLEEILQTKNVIIVSQELMSLFREV